MDVLFETSILTWVEESSNNKFRQPITICISYSSNNTGQRKDLNIRATNPENAFMLYNLKLNEDDYHNLKTQQGLLIDFPSFPAKFVELLRACEGGQDKFQLHLIIQHSTAVLQVVEVNPFKHLVHLSLNLSTATDAVIKKYLSDCLRDLQKKHKDLHQKHDSETSQFTEKIKCLEESSIQLKTQLQGGARAKELELSEQSALLKEQMQKERDAGAHFQKEIQERADLAEKQLENKIKDLEGKSKKLFDEKCRYELQNRELIAKVKLYEEERLTEKGEIKHLKMEQNEMEKERQNDVKELHSVKTQLAVARQELKDNQLTITNIQEQLTVSTAQKSKLENQIDTQHYQCVKLENTVRSVSEEVVKGNEIITKMQNDLKNYRSKLKIKHMQTVQQEKTIQEKDEETRKQKKQIESSETEITDKQNIIEKLDACKLEMELRIDEYQKTLKSNENVIAWLNKQINDKVSLGIGPRSLPSLLRNTTADMRAPGADMRAPGPYGPPPNRGPIQDLRNTGSAKPMGQDRYNRGEMNSSSTPAIDISNTSRTQRGGDYHHLSSFENSKKDDSLLDECYLKDSENLVEDTLKSVSETPEQVITIGNRGKKVLSQRQNDTISSTQSKPHSILKRGTRSNEPPLMKAYAP
ncbi:spindle assembly abnormal protein 6 homolog [Bolinopsis microptera]|uniref:spindle assembly abnormal protein 6 homolog n=1 Tax=Bolinopsis microptera TaxID=2820187 RepID=UPI00307932CC